MKTMKLALAAVALSAVLLLAGCSSSPYNDGTFTGQGNGFYGPLSVSVTIARGKISEIKVDHKDTPGISDDAFAKLIPAVIKKQDAQVDIVSGVTASSRGFIAAAEQALNKAKK